MSEKKQYLLMNLPSKAAKLSRLHTDDECKTQRLGEPGNKYNKKPLLVPRPNAGKQGARGVAGRMKENHFKAPFRTRSELLPALTSSFTAPDSKWFNSLISQYFYRYFNIRIEIYAGRSYCTEMMQEGQEQLFAEFQQRLSDCLVPGVSNRTKSNKIERSNVIERIRTQSCDHRLSAKSFACFWPARARLYLLLCSVLCLYCIVWLSLPSPPPSPPSLPPPTSSVVNKCGLLPLIQYIMRKIYVMIIMSRASDKRKKSKSTSTGFEPTTLMILSIMRRTKQRNCHGL